MLKGLLAGVNVLPMDQILIHLCTLDPSLDVMVLDWFSEGVKHWRAEQLGLVQFGLILYREPRYFHTHCHNRRDCNICLFLGHSPLYLFASFYIVLLCY